MPPSSPSSIPICFLAEPSELVPVQDRDDILPVGDHDHVTPGTTRFGARVTRFVRRIEGGMPIPANARQILSMTVDNDLQSRPPMPILIAAEGVGGVRLTLKQTSCILLVMGTLLLGVPGAGMAQTVTRTFDDLRAESHHGETVYVTDLAGATTKGRVLRISANSIALIVKNQTREWPASEVTWITQRRGSAGRGALIGLAVGAVIGPVLVALDNGGDDYVLFFRPFLRRPRRRHRRSDRRGKETGACPVRGGPSFDHGSGGAASGAGRC